MSNYPEAFDDDLTLYLVKDALKVSLGMDYKPGDATIYAEGDISQFPPTGIITLVDQCAIPEERNVSFHYGKKTSNYFTDLELTSDSVDCFKPKKLTNITMQVMANHREALKDSILAIESFLGTKHTVDKQPNGSTIFGRINFLMKVLMSPKAWFVADKTNGIAPFTVNFTFAGTGNTGPVGDVSYTWRFDEEEFTTTDPTFQKTFLNPGKYTIGLTIKNYYGEDEVKFVDMIYVKGAAPEEAMIRFQPQDNQMHLLGDNWPKLRATVNQLINIEIPQQIHENKKTFAGELVDPNSKRPLDHITKYTWNLGDELPHGNSTKTKALYTVGGLYDLVLKTESSSGSYRITTYEDCIDIVESTNLWLWSNDTNQIQAQEFGLVSEVLKTATGTYVAGSNDSFLESDRAKFEFSRNNGAARADKTKSGDGGAAILYWATGRNISDNIASENIGMAEYNGFADTYTTKSSIQRPWNWAALNAPGEIHFILGSSNWQPSPTISLTNQTKLSYSIADDFLNSHTLEYKDYKNGAHELTQNPGVFDHNFTAAYGHFTAYRTVWKDNTGYLLRNSSLGEHFCFQDFYRTDGTIGSPFQGLVKLPSLPGNGHVEGSLVALNGGVYFFNNYGQTYCYNDQGGVWETVNPHNRVAKRDLDKLLAASDESSKAYINIEGVSFFKFNELDMTYTSLHQSPAKNNWLMMVY